MYISFLFFFKEKTAYEVRISDWSSDVCSSDLQWSNDCGSRRSDELAGGQGPPRAKFLCTSWIRYRDEGLQCRYFREAGHTERVRSRCIWDAGNVAFRSVDICI